MRRVAWLLLLASCGPELGEIGRMPEDVPVENARFDSLVQAYLSWHYAQHPGIATRDGVHDYDDMLGSASREEMEGRVESLYYHLKELWLLDRPKLSEDRRIDARILEGQIQAELVDLEQRRVWERDPNFYHAIADHGLSTLSAPFETLEARQRHAIRRLQGVGPLLAEARGNLAEPSRIHVEVAIERFTELHTLVKDGMARTFAPTLLPCFVPGGLPAERNRLRDWREFRAARLEAVKRIEEFIDWMRKDLLPRATGPAAIGAHDFAQLLSFRELVRESPEALLKEAYSMMGRLDVIPRAIGPSTAVRRAFPARAWGTGASARTAVVAIEFHCHGLSLEESIAFLVKEAGLSREQAEREAREIAVDPMAIEPWLGMRAGSVPAGLGPVPVGILNVQNP